IDVLGLLRRKTTRENKSVAMISHEIKLTCLMADYLMIIGQDGEITTGKTESLMAAGALEGAFDWSSGFFDYPSYSLEIVPELAAGSWTGQTVLIRGRDPGLVLIARFLLKNGIRPYIWADADSYLGCWARSLRLSFNPGSGLIPPEGQTANDRPANESLCGSMDQPTAIIVEQGIDTDWDDAYRNVVMMEYDGDALTLIRRIENQILPKP
ncbi:MAG: hypothetical protein KBA26_15245, partial [Candidatus Delongbacteria bacterium]|nr:hypothetical protein [Candidatus Delongbacteria bacterium]